MPDAPDWAAFLGDGYTDFRRIVVAELQLRGLTYDPEHVDCGVIYTQSSGSLGLANMARLCHAAAPDTWPEIVAEQLRRALAKPVDLDLEVASPRMRLRIVPERLVGEKLVSRPLADGLALAVAVDLPEHVVFVSPTDLARWERTAEALFELADAQTRAEPALERADFDAIALLYGPSYFATSHIFFLERYLAAGRLGHLVGVPDRHALVAIALDGSGDLKSLGGLVSLCHLRFSEEPGAITDQIYWRKPDGVLVRIPCGVGDKGPWVAPPDAFNDAVLS